MVIDLHNDLLTKLSHGCYDIARRHRPAWFWNPLRLDIDLPKLRAAGFGGIGCALFAGFRLRAAARFWRQLELARRLASRYADRLELVESAAGLRDARVRGRVGLFLGVEGSYVVEADLEASLARLVAGGVRYLGPVWERASRAGSSCRSPEDGGLTDFGRDLVRACERHGLLLDVSHASRKTFWDMAEVSSAPLFASHAGAAGMRPHPRNLEDDQIREIARRGGVVGVIFVAAYVGGAFGSLAAVADHVEHVARVGGEDAVALGSDFDGFMPLVRGMRDAADLPRLTQLMRNRGWREPQLRKLLGENALRLFSRAWAPRAVSAAPQSP